jgi:hypothetical protein
MTTLATRPGISQDRGSGTKADLKSENGAASILAYGPARSTITGTPLSPEELELMDAYWRASLYLCLGMLYLKDWRWPRPSVAFAKRSQTFPQRHHGQACAYGTQNFRIDWPRPAGARDDRAYP